MITKIAKILIISLFFFFSPVQKINGLETIKNEERQKLIEQINFLQKEILRLTSLIKDINFGKSINAYSYLAVDLLEDSIILEKNDNSIYTIASITKLMSSVIATENIDLEKRIILTEEMLRPTGYSPSLFLGANVSAKDLIKASLIQSTNDASNVLTYFLKEGEFINLMNQKAKDLNMNNSIFYDASGLNPLNKSNVSDLYKLLKYVYKNHPQILEISRNNDFWLPDITGRMLKFQNVNNFYNHPNFVGGKTGYLPEARQTFVSIFNIKEKPTAIILLYSGNRQNDVLKIIDYIEKNK